MLFLVSIGTLALGTYSCGSDISGVAEDGGVGGGSGNGGGSAMGGGVANGGGSATGGGVATGGGSVTGGGSAIGGGGATGGGTVVTSEPNIMFVSSVKVPPGSLGGVAGGDSFCQSLAADAGLPGRYAAYLSFLDGGVWNANTHLVQASGLDGGPRGWVRPDGEPVFDSLDDITVPKFMHLPRMNERRAFNAYPNFVATGTYWDGVPTFTCDDWTDPNALKSVVAGEPNFGSQSWVAGIYPTCADPVSVYCFGVDRNAPIVVPPPPAGSRRLFLTYYPIAGNHSATGQCTAEAIGAGLPNGASFIGYQFGTQYPSDYLNLDGGDWYRLDGIKVLTRDEVLRPDGGPVAFLAAPNVAIGGEHLRGPVWMGDINTQPGSGQALNCTNWSSTTGTAWTIDAQAENPSFGQKDCSQTAHAICIEP
jgi:hypothetical protein